MRISQFQLIRYGKFTERALQLPQGERDIHLIVGPNEAGKSTLRQAFGDWLFGFPVRTPMAFLHPMPELRLGGTLEPGHGQRQAGRPLSFERTKGNKNTLRAPGDTPLPDAALAPWLASLQRDAYERMYGLDHARLLAGGADILSASDDIGRLLFQSAAGIEHLGQTLQQLEQEADTLWGPRKAGARLYYQARDDFEAAGKELKQHLLRARDWQSQHDSLEATAAQLRESRLKHQALAQQSSRLQRIRRVAPLLQALDELQARHHDLLAQGDITLLDSDAALVLAKARRALALVQADLQRLQEDEKQLQAELTGVAIDHDALALADDIVELNERRLQFRAHPGDIAKRQQELHSQWQRVQELAGGLGWAAASEAQVRQRLPVAASRSRLSRLLKQHAAAEQTLLQAQAQLAERQQQIDQVQHTLRALPVTTLQPALLQALEAAQPFAPHEASQREWQHKGQALAEKIDAALAAMGAWRQPPEALAGMLAPEPATVQALQMRQRDLERELQRLDDTHSTKAQEIRQAELALQQLVRKFQPVSLEQVQQSRQQRDQLWQTIQAAPQQLPQQAPAFEAHMVQADQLADARLERAQHEAERQTSAERLQAQQLELQHLQGRQQDTQHQVEQCAAQWQALASAAGMPALPLELAGTWLQQRQTVLTLLQQQAELQQQTQASNQAATAAHQALWAALPGHTSDTPAAPPLADCLRQARAHIQASDKAQGQRDTLAQQLADWRASLGALQDGVDKNAAAWQQWHEKWRTALVDAGYPSGTAPDAVEAQIDTLQEIERLLSAMRSTRSDRIDAMQADLDGLAAGAQALAGRLAPQRQGMPTDELVLGFAQRLEQARQMHGHAQQLQARLDKAQSELAAAHKKQHIEHAHLAPLMSAAAVTDLDALAHAVERSDQRRAIEQKIANTQEELARGADGYPEAELRAQAADSDPDTLKATLAALTAQSEEVLGQIEEQGRQHGSQKAAFDALDGASHAAQAEARRQEAIATMADAMQRHMRLHNASRLLRWSMEKFRQTRQGPMLAQASEIFRTLTQASFDRLLVDADGSSQRLFGVRSSGEQVDVEGMSEGTRDQLYLALRLAALHLQTAEGQALPFIADDLFINFDDGRTLAGLQALGTLSRKLQVIVLTHHAHLVPLAQQALGASLNVVRL
ncbi:MAG TPA: AAA family ATPase [Alicycliphilus sp.]|nr:AAA family ATPase [Alicycliphilus sp.]